MGSHQNLEAEIVVPEAVTKGSENAQLVNLEIEQLRLPLQTVLEGLRPRIDNGDYRVVIGEDVSGRIPALIVWRVLSSLAHQRGEVKPGILFIGTFHYIDPKIAQDQIQQVSDFLGNYYTSRTYGVLDANIARTLIVTEDIVQGIGLNPIAAGLREQRLPYDIASVNVRASSNIDSLQMKLGATIVAGGREDEIPNIHDNKPLSGVRKRRGALFGQRLDRIGFGPQEIINSARYDVARLSRELVDWYTRPKRLTPQI